ncbi:hypothetical protein [Synechococcus sp. RSCCF101]|uniref:hypothetical protein n=1 Tax=Synechococcus sp. RSCCF101 TaxID=2511069 RepID=UPI00177F287A|nr:hypothetical protein [Synechococcus sp. RSCCF101]
MLTPVHVENSGQLLGRIAPNGQHFTATSSSDSLQRSGSCLSQEALITGDNITISCDRLPVRQDQDETSLVGPQVYMPATLTVTTTGGSRTITTPGQEEEWTNIPFRPVLLFETSSCPIGWERHPYSLGNYILGASPDYPVNSYGGDTSIKPDGLHNHRTTDDIEIGVETFLPGLSPSTGLSREARLHTHTTDEFPHHDHGGELIPPYLSLSVCRPAGR